MVLIGGASKSSKKFIDIIKITIDSHHGKFVNFNKHCLAIVIIVILLQRSEGGALGLGVSQDISRPLDRLEHN